MVTPLVLVEQVLPEPFHSDPLEKYVPQFSQVLAKTTPRKAPLFTKLYRSLKRRGNWFLIIYALDPRTVMLQN